jgi:hypothetical protein
LTSAAAFVIEMAAISFAVLYPGWSRGKHGMEYAPFMGIVDRRPAQRQVAP